LVIRLVIKEDKAALAEVTLEKRRRVMRRISFGFLAVGLVLALGLNVADAQTKPSAGMMRPGMMGPGMMGGPVAGRCAGIMAPGKGGNTVCKCGGVMAPAMKKGPMGRCEGMMRGPMMGDCDHCIAGRGMMGRHMGMYGEKGMPGMHHRLWRYIMGLDLDQNQKARIMEIKTDLMKKMIRKRADLKIAGLELRGLVHADKVDMKKVEAKVKEIEGLRSSMLLAGIEAAETVKSQLTAEQRTELDDMMDAPMRCTMMGGIMPDRGMMGGNDIMGMMPQSSDEGQDEGEPSQGK
jgi:Spy/CpxP family protein refolding chaperone